MRRVPGLLLAALSPSLVGWSFFGPFHDRVVEGNEEVRKGELAAGLERYDEAAERNPSSPIPDFNRGVALAGLGRTEDALTAFERAAAGDDARLKAHAFFNKGNLRLEAGEYAPAVEEYLRSLDYDPASAPARKNLEIALQRLQEQQQQQQQPQDSPPDDDSEDQQEPQSQGEEPETDPEQNESPDEQEESSPEPEQTPPEERLSREDAERLLNAIQSDELKVLQQLQDQEEGTEGVVTYDW